MRNFYTLIVCFLCAFTSVAQPENPQVRDTGIVLIPQEQNIITDKTILKVENIGAKVNSSIAELRPTISADGNLLFFIRENHPSNKFYNSVPNSQDIWFSMRDSSGTWSRAVHLGYPLNTSEYNAVFWISPDNNKLLIRNAFINGDYFGDGVSFCYLLEDGYWSKPEMLKIRNFGKYDRGNQYGASMANDGRTLLLYMSEDYGSFRNDIYVCFLQDDGTWSEPKSLGKKINSPKTNELTPYLASDNVTLYFSSDRSGGLGSNDIWMSKRLDDSWQKWSEPTNLGAPINTADWDAFFTMDAGGEFAYMTTNENSVGASDIVKVKLFEEKKPDPVLLVSGNVYDDKTKKPLGADLIYEVLPSGDVAGNGNSSAMDGSFKVVLPYNKNYLIKASAPHYFAISENLNLDTLFKQGYKEIHKDLYLVPIEIGQVFRLNNVFFDFDKWDLRPASFVELRRVVLLLQENPGIEIELRAHTDSYGTDEYNFKLSDNRARSCMEYIISQGIDASRITSHGYGESQPISTNETDEGRQLNRRVEFKILKN